MKYFESLSSHQKELIERHLDLVIEANASLNLTRIASKEEGMVLHVEDCLSALPEFNGCPDGVYADMGSGAGYPGIPLSIASGRKTLLVDARKKKMDAVEAMIASLGLDGQIDVFAGRAELLARKNAVSFSVVTARALSQLSVLLELASPLLRRGGKLICYKAHVEDEELENALRVQKLVGMEMESDRSFMLDERYYRRIIVFEKTGKSKITLPRQEGIAQKKPL